MLHIQAWTRSSSFNWFLAPNAFLSHPASFATTAECASECERGICGILTWRKSCQTARSAGSSVSRLERSENAKPLWCDWTERGGSALALKEVQSSRIRSVFVRRLGSGGSRPERTWVNSFEMPHSHRSVQSKATHQRPRPVQLYSSQQSGAKIPSKIRFL